MKRKALKLVIPFMLLTGVVGCESSVIDEDHAIVSVEDAKNEDIYVGNLFKLEKEFQDVAKSLSTVGLEGTTTDSEKEQFEEKVKKLKSVTAEIRRLTPKSNYKDTHKEVSKATKLLDKSFDKQSDAIKKEDSTKLKEAIKDMNRATIEFVKSVDETNDIYMKEIEELAKTIGK
ncbi:hypothetical protein [Bacillus cereus group sp. BfR-BA-01310]|uniref:DUF7018 domain-containing (lipo)protein n=1 Tax=Bacillus cereus group sp. BfR-BA-01310 TaxID=2920287 RepID=UPI001F5849CB|nr:hypothetical protein [Bacillus cereus group sp. BfR-BA-01310]